MSIPSVYINLEDDVSKVLTRLKANRSTQVILVCPKRCFLFSSLDNLSVLKQQVDLIGKEVFVLTMDERGRHYAQDAGFQLKFLPKAGGNSAFSDVKFAKKTIPAETKTVFLAEPETQREIKKMTKKFVQAHQQDTTGQITAPKVSQLPQIKVTDSVFPAEPAEHVYEQKEKGKTSLTKIITGVVAVSLIVILLLVFVILPKASVVVYARTEPVTRDMDISMSTAAPGIDISKLIIPAIKIDEAASINSSFQSQGKQEVGNKATGTVKIYNFTKLPLNLKASTTTLNVAGKTYNLISDIQGLKPTTYKNAKTKEVDPNSLGDSVNIIATQGGDDFNLPAGTRMEITNQVLGSKPQLLYAETDSEINGGTTRYLSLITQDDTTQAEAQLQSQALDQIRTKLKNNGLVLADNAYTSQVTQFITDNPVGTQTPSFHASLQIKFTGLAYKQDDLDNLIKQRISQTLSADKTLQDQQSSSTDVTIKALDLNNQVASMAVHYEGQAVYDIDLPNISSELVAKTKDQANEILRSKAEIDRVDITLAPIWQKNFPLFASKIDVTISK